MADTLDITIDAERFFTALDYYVSVLPKELRDKAMRRQFRILIQRIMAWTPPHNGKRGSNMDDALKHGEAAILRDLKRVAVVLEDDRAFYALAGGRSDGTHFDLNLKTGKVSSLQIDSTGDILVEQHRRLRNRRGTINHGQKPIVVTRKAGLEHAAKRPLSRVGLAKSGWVPAFARLGGMSPAWIARHGGSQGAYLERLDEFTVEVRATNWASSIGSLAPRIVNSSLRAQANAMIRELEKAASSAKARAKLGKEIARS